MLRRQGDVKRAVRRHVPVMVATSMRRDAGRTSPLWCGSAACFVNQEADALIGDRPGGSSGAPLVERRLRACFDEAVAERRRYGDPRTCAVKQPRGSWNGRHRIGSYDTFMKRLMETPYSQCPVEA